MAHLRMLSTLLLILVSPTVLAAAPALDTPLPTLNISDKGELIMEGEEFNFKSWSSDINPGKIHVIQYFGANLGDRDVFQPFTDMLQAELSPGTVHVSTVLNLDAALWGTTGFVMSELKKNKKMHPAATMVLDAEGSGVTEWELGEAGTGLVIMDKQGVVKFFTRGSPTEQQMASTLALIRTLDES